MVEYRMEVFLKKNSDYSTKGIHKSKYDRTVDPKPNEILDFFTELINEYKDPFRAIYFMSGRDSIPNPQYYSIQYLGWNIEPFPGFIFIDPEDASKIDSWIVKCLKKFHYKAVFENRISDDNK